jgi:beta-galactosidase
MVRRVGDGRSYAFVLNHSDEAVTVAVSGHDLVADRRCAGEVVVGPGGVACVREERGDSAGRSAS